MDKVLLMFLKADDGATAIEYALIASLIFLAIATGVSMMGVSIKDLYDKVAEDVSSVM